jgi:hypothetical protein
MPLDTPQGPYRLRMTGPGGSRETIDADAARDSQAIARDLGAARASAQRLADAAGTTVVIEWHDMSDPKPAAFPSGDVEAERAWLSGRAARLEARAWVSIGHHRPASTQDWTGPPSAR